MTAHPAFLTVIRGTAPLVVSLPHTGTDIPDAFADDLVSPWLARKDCDWWIERLYDFAAGMGASVVRTSISRTAIDVNRDPSGVSLYPGQATTELCPTTSFDGEPLYKPGKAPDVAARRAGYFDPYHAALEAEIEHARAVHGTMVLYDCHSIRSVIPRLFPGTLPNFNIGTNSGASCAPELQAAVEAICDATAFSHVSNGRFKGGYITRHYGAPERGVHAVQMELACRSYMPDPAGSLGPDNWPAPYDPAFAAPVRAALIAILNACLAFARSQGARS
ncbi:N-formylglutamate deformylase [Ancylobacter defluvii]|uniref:N-formylglutamate deformylase n=1 Tax=Ancylobacter defluvii TaxID=1282440 RepID=A0A9W6JUJ5_9HYPH|nr:N-formylglutamate deformylase [Ancylobacter defluvii]MBS7590495.1 N-formylglutamate deformylase [Ancylobacter defluvii]GLK83417.1 N-formylglutamate deformylase [Ancylobacter defluvii]